MRRRGINKEGKGDLLIGASTLGKVVKDERGFLEH
jgi:hypothetical protein